MRIPLILASLCLSVSCLSATASLAQPPQNISQKYNALKGQLNNAPDSERLREVTKFWNQNHDPVSHTEAWGRGEDSDFRPKIGDVLSVHGGKTKATLDKRSLALVKCESLLDVGVESDRLAFGDAVDASGQSQIVILYDEPFGELLVLTPDAGNAVSLTNSGLALARQAYSCATLQVKEIEQ